MFNRYVHIVDAMIILMCEVKTTVVAIPTSIYIYYMVSSQTLLKSIILI